MPHTAKRLAQQVAGDTPTRIPADVARPETATSRLTAAVWEMVDSLGVEEPARLAVVIVPAYGGAPVVVTVPVR